MFGFNSRTRRNSRHSFLDEPVVMFEDVNGVQYPWTHRNAFEGTQILGQTGAGKSAGSGATIARAFIRLGWGGLVLTVKPDERDRWVSYVRGAGREADLRIFDASGRERFNFLDHEYRSTKGIELTRNLVSLLLAAVTGGDERESLVEPFWREALEALLLAALDLDVLAHGSAQLTRVVGIVRSAPRSCADVRSPTWRRNSSCWAAIEKAANRPLPPERFADLKETCEYFLVEFAQLADRTRSVIVTSMLSKLCLLLRSPFRDLFASELPDTLTPEESHFGKIILIDLPVKTFGEVGRLVQVLYKTTWQAATERRAAQLDPRSPTYDPKQRPVFLWSDEAQHFISAKSDALFQQTARAAWAAPVLLTQGISTYQAQLGKNAHAAVDSLLGGCGTKILHCNSCPLTNHYGEQLFGHGRVTLNSRGISSREDSVSRNAQESFLPLVPSNSFITLKTGGPANDGIVEGYVCCGGRIWNGENRHVLKARFRQSLEV